MTHALCEQLHHAMLEHMKTISLGGLALEQKAKGFQVQARKPGKNAGLNDASSRSKLQNACSCKAKTKRPSPTCKSSSSAGLKASRIFIRCLVTAKTVQITPSLHVRRWRRITSRWEPCPPQCPNCSRLAPYRKIFMSSRKSMCKFARSAQKSPKTVACSNVSSLSRHSRSVSFAPQLQGVSGTTVSKKLVIRVGSQFRWPGQAPLTKPTCPPSAG